MKFSLLTTLSLALLAASNPLVSRQLEKRGLEKCKTLQANSNNGGRKIAIVVDESGSMADSDPYNLRIAAARAVNDWLISNKEASGGKKADYVSLIGFDDTSRVLYYGDPGKAGNTFDQITDLGGTFIAGGVDEAISQLTTYESSNTANRSGIVVLTDGSDSDTETLVSSIGNARSQGIRVSFGFLAAYGLSYQDPDVLSAILATGGMYATIDGATAQNAFVNLVIVHGLTDNDNPSSQNTPTVYNGLSVAFVLDNSGTETLTYTAQSNEHLTFSISSVSAGTINVTATDTNGKDLGHASVKSTSYTPQMLQVTAPSAGALQLKIQGSANQKDAVFIVGTNSSIPLTNCTLGDTGKSGLSPGAKAGIGISVPIILGLMAAGGYFGFKYWKGLPPKGGSAPAYTPNQPPMDYKQPYVQTTSLPTPQPPNAPPGWSMPPPPKAPNGPSNPNDSNKPDNYNYNSPHQPSADQLGTQQPFNQADTSHPTQADPSSHFSQQDPSSHFSQQDPSSHFSQQDPSSHFSQQDPSSHFSQQDPSSHFSQQDPSNQNPQNPQVPQNPQNPQDHYKRLPTPRFPLRLFGRRKKKGDENQNGTQVSYHNQLPEHVGNMAYPQPVHQTQSDAQQYRAQYTVQQQQQYGASGAATVPRPFVVPTGTQTYPPPAQTYTYNADSNAPQNPQYFVPQPQYEAPAPSVSPPQQYPTPANVPLPQSLPGSPPPQQYAPSVGAPYQPPQQNITQQFPQPPPSVGNDRSVPQEAPSHDPYNVSPILQPAVPVKNTENENQDIISSVSAASGSISRKPVGGY